MKQVPVLTAVGLLVLATCVLIVTANDYFTNQSPGNALAVRAITDSSLFADVWLTKNPPHGQPGHNHALPDGALLHHDYAPAPMATPTSSMIDILADDSLASASGKSLNPPHGKPGHRCDIPVGAPLYNASMPNATGKASTATLNPAHGQPGHRCDLAVGAPLYTTSGKAVQAQTVSNSTPGKAPILNPAHGQPFHRCDIAVGAPLNRAAVKTSANQTSQTDQGKKPKLNPAHGQPYHRCDLAVGALLDSTSLASNSQAAAPSPVLNIEKPKFAMPVYSPSLNDSSKH